MTTKYDFEKELEKIAEKFYFNAASNQVAPRGGNSAANEIYFGWVSADLRQKLNCQQLILRQGKCPDSGIFGDFHYKTVSQINWDDVRNGKIIVLELKVPNDQMRYLEVAKEKIQLPEKINAKTKISIQLNDLDYYGEFFGIEYKASLNKNPNSINVASFNNSCPSKTKNVIITSAKLIHNYPTTKKLLFNNDKSLKIVPIQLKVRYSLYYMIVNDEVITNKSKIKHIFVCSADFFSADTPEDIAEILSKEKKPMDFGIKTTLLKVSLRYRPFFESRVIEANGFGIYTSWAPKLPGEAREEEERKLLLQEVARVEQRLIDNESGQEIPNEELEDGEPGKVIYLCLRENRIRERSVA